MPDGFPLIDGVQFIQKEPPSVFTLLSIFLFIAGAALITAFLWCLDDNYDIGGYIKLPVCFIAFFACLVFSVYVSESKYIVSIDDTAKYVEVVDSFRSMKPLYGDYYEVKLK